MQNGQYRCENCNVESANFKYRMIVGVSWPFILKTFVWNWKQNIEIFTKIFCIFSRWALPIGHRIVGLPFLLMKLRKYSVSPVMSISALERQSTKTMNTNASFEFLNQAKHLMKLARCQRMIQKDWMHFYKRNTSKHSCSSCDQRSKRMAIASATRLPFRKWNSSITRTTTII